jgi:hypothetical protein
MSMYMVCTTYDCAMSNDRIQPLCDEHHTPMDLAGFVTRADIKPKRETNGYACSKGACSRVYVPALGYCNMATTSEPQDDDFFSQVREVPCGECGQRMYIAAFDKATGEVWECEAGHDS